MSKTISVLEFSWFKMSEEVNSCETHLTPSRNQMRIRFACHHLSHKDVHFAGKQCGEFTAIFCRNNCPSVNLIHLLLRFIRLQLARNAKLN